LRVSEALPGGTTAPTVLRIILGKRLKELRESSGRSLDEAAGALDVTTLTVRRMENAQVGLKPVYVKELLSLYGAEGETDAFMEMAERAGRHGWWHQYRHAVPDWFRGYVSLESAASVIRVYEPHYVTGLLQTRDYAREVIRAGFPNDSVQQLEHRVELRMRRQSLLRRADAPILWVVMEEAGLRREVGSSAVMREQMDRLIDVAGHPGISFRFLPLAAGPHPCTSGHITYFRFHERELQDVVYTEVGLTSAVYLDQRPEVGTHLEAHSRTSRLAYHHISDPRTYLHHLRKEFEA
jgi:transcriptional regulator with XRE-family HTH domain